MGSREEAVIVKVRFSGESLVIPLRKSVAEEANLKDGDHLWVYVCIRGGMHAKPVDSKDRACSCTPEPKERTF